MHAIAEDLSSSQDNLTLSKFESSLGHTKVNVKLVQEFDVENIPINLQHDKAIYEELLCSQGSACRLPPISLPAQAKAIPLQPKGAEG